MGTIEIPVTVIWALLVLWIVYLYISKLCIVYDRDEWKHQAKQLAEKVGKLTTQIGKLTTQLAIKEKEISKWKN